MSKDINKLNVILIALDKDAIYDAINSIYTQTYNNLEIFILTSKDNLVFEKSNKYNCTIIKVDNKNCIFNELISLSSILTGDFVTFMNSLDINSSKRFEKQISFLNSNKNINICSCLEMPIDNDLSKIETLKESNNFITGDDINSIISASYLPLDLYTFVFRKSFLVKLLYYSKNYYFLSEIDLILFFLRFEKINKVPKILYYVKNPRIPYKECLNYYDGPNTTNKLAIFNQNRITNNQDYFNEIINTKRQDFNYKNQYKYTIIAILNKLNIGGTESYVINLANKLKLSNIKLVILTNNCFNKELFSFYNIEVHVLDLKDKNKLTKALLGIKNIKLIQIHLNADIFLCPIIKSIINVPIILTIHGIYYSEKVLTEFLPYIYKIIFVSNYSKKYYNSLVNKLSENKYTVIPNSIESHLNILTYENKLKKYLNLSKDSTIILYCSRLSYSKSNLAMLFLKSFEEIAHKNKNAFAVIIGDGLNVNPLINLMNKINYKLAENRVFILGNKFNIFDYYNDSNLVVGTGRVALEAMSLGKAVISFGSNGTVNIINNKNIDEMVDSNFGDHSFFSPKLDSQLIIDKLSNFIDLLINSNEKLKELADFNKSYVEKHLSLDKLNKFYIDLCENKYKGN